MKADTKPKGEEPQYDDDITTDNEQIKSSMELINNDIELVFTEYLKQKQLTAGNAKVGQSGKRKRR